ncbi:MAG: hypothetical protein QOD81_294 [Solirubrobacteraceae bacterium]|nr:hypothetical protein [Solirubrobacteraceae bacterium]
MRRRLTLYVLAGVVALSAFTAFGPKRAASAGGAPADVAGARYRLDEASAEREHAAVLPQGARRAGFAFAPGTAPQDQRAFTTAIVRARPEARRLIDLVDGLTDVRIGPTGAQALGITTSGGPRYDVVVDLGGVAQRYGQRGIDRVVLHELAHVVDHALVDDALMATLLARIPAGWGCEDGRAGACATAPERFAESFAKWATGDIGVDLYIGYKVPPPGPTLDAWGAPLARLGA